MEKTPDQQAAQRGKTGDRSGKWMPWPLAATIGMVGVLIIGMILGRQMHLMLDEKNKKFEFTAFAANTAVAITRSADEKKDSATPTPAEKITEDFILEKLKDGIQTLPTAKVLWVDDRPENNQAERLALSVLGIYCDSYTDTNHAIDAIRWNKSMGYKPYNIIISNYGRPSNPNDNGENTLKSVRVEEGYDSTPFIFYTSQANLAAASQAAATEANAEVTIVRDSLLKKVLENLPKNKPVATP